MKGETLIERKAVVDFLRSCTNLHQLADLIDAGVHRQSLAEIRRWCKARKIAIRSDT